MIVDNCDCEPAILDPHHICQTVDDKYPLNSQLLYVKLVRNTSSHKYRRQSSLPICFARQILGPALGTHIVLTLCQMAFQKTLPQNEHHHYQMNSTVCLIQIPVDTL